MSKKVHLPIIGATNSGSIDSYNLFGVGEDSAVAKIGSFREILVASGNCLGTCLSPDSRFLAVSMVNADYFFKRQGDVYALVGKIDVTRSSPQTGGMSWSYDSKFFTYFVNGGDNVYLYKRDGNTFSKITVPNPGFTVDNATRAVFNPASPNLLIWRLNTLVVFTYDQAGVFTRVDPSQQILSSRWCHFDSTGTLLFCVGTFASAGTVICEVYSFKDNKITKKAEALTPAGMARTVRSACISPDGKSLFILASASSSTEAVYIYRYSLNGSVFAAEVSLLSPGTSSSVLVGSAVSPDGRYLCVAITTTPFIKLYRIEQNGSLTEIALPVTPTAYSSFFNFSQWVYDGVGHLYASTLFDLLTGAADLNALKILLLSNEASFDFVDTTWQAVTANGVREVHGGGWPQGGKLLPDVSLERFNDYGAKLVFGDVSQAIVGSTLSFYSALIYDQTSGKPLVFIDLAGEALVEEGNAINFTASPEGLILFQKV